MDANIFSSQLKRGKKRPHTSNPLNPLNKRHCLPLDDEDREEVANEENLTNEDQIDEEIAEFRQKWVSYAGDQWIKLTDRIFLNVVELKKGLDKATVLRSIGKILAKRKFAQKKLQLTISIASILRDEEDDELRMFYASNNTKLHSFPAKNMAEVEEQFADFDASKISESAVRAAPHSKWRFVEFGYLEILVSIK